MSLDVRAWQQRKGKAGEADLLLADLGKQVSRMQAAPAAEKAARTVRRARRSSAESDPPAGCELVRVEYRECVDEDGQVHSCRCELYQCDSYSFWNCVIID
jgi:hypothetical protein